MISVLVVDDSPLMRREIRRIIDSESDMHVVACARNGKDALELVRQHQPDVVTMDINMPVMDGITALQMIMMEMPRPVIMLSSLTQEGAVTTFECLELGAVDFVGKPSGTVSKDIGRQASEIVHKIRAAATSSPRPKRPTARRAGGTQGRRPLRRAARNDHAATRVVAIGISTGGPKTLLDVLPLLPADLDAAVLVVQHMPEAFTGPFAKRLDGICELEVCEAKAGDILLPGHAYVARGGKHMVFAKPNSVRGAMVRYVTRPADVPHIPSVDVMMCSAAEVFGSDVIGVLMTGMGADGAEGMVRIKQAGGQTIAESEETCVVYGMPAQAVARGCVDAVLPSYAIADHIMQCLACPV